MTEDENQKKAVKEQFARNAKKYVFSPSHAKADDLDLLNLDLERKHMISRFGSDALPGQKSRSSK